MLATGLSALYSSLPRKIEVRGDDWHALRREDWVGVSSLVLFMNSLEFCNAVVQVSHPLVRCQLLDYVHNGFLVPVMGPSLHKVRLLTPGCAASSTRRSEPELNNRLPEMDSDVHLLSV